LGWDDAGGYPTIGKWDQQLVHSWNLGGRNVTEQDPGGSGNDTCWFSGSAIAKFEAITGGSWPVETDSTWGIDYVGWFPASVTYYRNQGRAPCGTSFLQDMQIDCSAGDVHYRYWTLGMNITSSEVSSEKGSSQQTRIWVP